MTTNYRDTFITLAPDCALAQAREPAKEGSVARLQLELLRAAPYARTSDELLFEVHAIRAGLPMAERDAAREQWLAKPQACLRASALVKTHGWGLHHDADARVAAYAVESNAYRELAARPDLAIVPGMRNRRA